MSHPFLARTGTPASRMGLGSHALSGTYGPVDARTVADLLAFAVDEGVALIDGAGCTRSEPARRRAVHRVIAARRDQVVLSGHLRPADEAADPVAACEALLRRLRVDYLDICFLDAGLDPRTDQGPDTGPNALLGTALADVPLEERIGAVAGLVEAGKVRHLGVRNATGGQLRLAHRTHPIAALAVDYSLAARGAETDRLPAARELGLAVVAAAPLNRGLLTGRVPVAADPPGLIPATAATLRRLQELAAELDVGMARLALAWLLSRGADIIPVPSTRNRVHLEMNMMAARMTVPAEALERLTDAAGATGADAPEAAGRSDGAAGEGAGPPRQ